MVCMLFIARISLYSGGIPHTGGRHDSNASVYGFRRRRVGRRRHDRKTCWACKGANLAEMASLGLPVPHGFTITTEVCTWFYDKDNTYPTDLKKQVEAALKKIEKTMGAKFGDAKNPLLLSVRSGARVSMPGMMDTVLNLGLNDDTVAGLAKRSGDERFAWDSYRRFIQMYGDVVLGVPHHDFEDIIDEQKRDDCVMLDTDITAEGWKKITAAYKEIVLKKRGKPFPMDPQEQLWGAIGAVFQSWMTPRAVSYRTIHEIPENWGTAVTVQVDGVPGNTWVRTAAPASPSRATRQPARIISTANTSSTRRARTWWPESARRSRCRSARRKRKAPTCPAWKS